MTSVAMAALMHGILIFSRPTLTDDVYRYVWDGRVQAHGINPYHYPPNSPELFYLRDPDIYPSINRKPAVTVYPPAAEASYFLLWRIWPDNVHWFQAAMAAGGLLAGTLLMGLLKDLGYSHARALIFLWSPLLVFETAHAAHVDGLVLPFLVGAWWARVRGKDALTGFLLGVATAMKLYPAAPALLMASATPERKMDDATYFHYGNRRLLWAVSLNQRNLCVGLSASLF
jgi:alpha-1,6-mannosyltransferase